MTFNCVMKLSLIYLRLRIRRVPSKREQWC